MRPDEKEIRKTLDPSPALYRDLPQKEIELAVDRVWANLAPGAVDPSNSIPVRRAATHRRPRWLAVGAIAAAITLAVLVPPEMLHRAPAVFEDVAGSRNIEFGDIVRSGVAAGRALVLADTSRAEMRANSELLLERADDGVRIHLNKGSVLVKAARQRNGHLYVQTKDVTVSVIGTVFLVNAEEEGSRVAVIEGEVHVKQGTKETSLRKGEQVATNPNMEPIQLASLQQATPPAMAAPTRAKFEVVSIKPAGPQPAGARGGPGAGPSGREQTQVACPYSGTMLGPSRITSPRLTAWRLITWAYEPRACVLQTGLITGQPEWTTTDLYDFQATFPAGTPVYGFEQLQNGEAPRLQEMLQTMLEDRFKLKIRREKKEVAAFDLVVAKPGKMIPSKDQTPPSNPWGPGTQGARRGPAVGPGISARPGALYTGLDYVEGNQIAVSVLVRAFGAKVGRPIVDKTGLTGFFDMRLPISPDPDLLSRLEALRSGQSPPPPRPPSPAGRGLTLNDNEILEGLGLKLEPSRTAVDVFVIESIDKPTPN